MFGFTASEVKDLVISAVVLAFLFAWPFVGCNWNIMCVGFLFAVLLLVVSTAFLFHEICHKLVAQHFGCPAGYVMWPQGLILAAILKLTIGVLFAAPGAVMFYPFSRRGLIGRRETALISLAGPMANVLMALTYRFLFPASSIGSFGASINLFLAFFNLIPFPPLDGEKVFTWNIFYWFIAILAVVLLSFGMGVPLL